MTSTDAPKIKEAALWLANQKEPQPNVIQVLRQTFEITGVQAAQACTLANQYRLNRRAFG